jgi:hypothetical protein
MHVRLAGQGADVCRAQDVLERARSAGADLERVVERLDGRVARCQREADGGREAGGGDGGERRHPTKGGRGHASRHTSARVS